VYRNLRKLIELGYAQELPYGPGASHFDTTIEPHYHLRCVDCGRVVDLPIDEEAAPCLEEARKAAEGWTVSRQRVEFTGHCPDCREDQ
jgi:Fe2+ or Zn2+ uptake regulation protein